MHYVIGDIHNELGKLNSILNQIQLTGEDELIVLGDVFDRGGFDADPVGVYFALTGIQGKCTWVRGNHDQWLADYIKTYYGKKEKSRSKMPLYQYNSFELLSQRLTEVDMLNLADLILKLPLQKEAVIDNTNYLFAHAMTSHPNVHKTTEYYLMGNMLFDTFLSEGVEGYTSMCGHTPTDNVIGNRGNHTYLDEDKHSIWKNEKGNVFLLDCRCGFNSGRLACLCIETGQRYYSDSSILKKKSD